jgi:hypothetical protein
MGIFEKQYSKIISEELLRYFLEGKVPDIDIIGERISKVLAKDGDVTFQYFSQPSKSTFQIEQYNNALRQIKFDIDLFQEELLDLFGQSLKRVNFAELYYNINSHELRNLKSRLEAILFTIENADYYFSGAFDNFSDSSKTDLKKSTPSVLDIKEGVLALPIGGRNTKRISMLHLSNYDSWKVSTDVDPTIIDTESAVGDTRFGDMFTDVNAAWSYEIVTKESVPVSVQFIIPIAGAPEEEVEVFLNRLEISPHSLGKQVIKIRLSNDNVNYFSPAGYEAGITVGDASRTYAIDFETTLVQYAEITITKDRPDEVVPTADGNRYQYVFGLKSFAAFTVGRAQRATYYSKPFSFNETNSITKISIASNYLKLPGTTIKYSVALSDSEGNPQTNFFPINPVGGQTTSGATEVITLKNSNYKSERFSVGLDKTISDLQYGSVFRGRRFYKIKDQINPSPIFNTVELYRGFNGWGRDSSTAFTAITVPDCYLDFTTVDAQKLYTLRRETAAFDVDYYDYYIQYTGPTPLGNPPTNIYQQPRRRTKITLTRTPYYDQSSGHLLRRPLSVQGISDPTPNYAIYSVKHVKPAQRLRTSFNMSSGVYPEGNINTNPVIFNIPVTNFVIASTDPANLPTLEARAFIPNAQPFTLVLGLDYDIETYTVDGVSKPTGRILIKHHAASLLRPVNLPSPYTPTVGHSLDFTYTPEEDITHKVISINGNEIVIDYTEVPIGDVIEVTYRYTIESPNEIIRKSVRVYDKPFSDPTSKLLLEGTDYTLNGSNGLIRRLSTGGIAANGSVHVSFDFKNAELGTERFYTWCRIDDPAGVEIRFDLDDNLKKNRLQVDNEFNEKLYISGSFGLIDLTEAAGTPLLPPGWVQFIVVSKNPSFNSRYKSNLINQVIQLRDSNRKKIFREGNRYFSSVVAYKEPLTQKTLNHLKVNTLATDFESFAIDETIRDNPTLVVNFLPNSQIDLYNYSATEDDAQEGNPIRVPETYNITWYYVNTTTEEIDNNVIVRIDLERGSEAGGSITPKVFDYQLRVGF